jgi:uncharacterized membrane protein
MYTPHRCQGVVALQLALTCNAFAGGLPAFFDLGPASAAVGAADDGTVATHGVITGRLWRADRGLFQTIPNAAMGISADASTVFGDSGNQAFRWTAAEGQVAINAPSGPSLNTVAEGASYNGTAIVVRPLNQGQGRSFLWTTTGSAFLPSLVPNGYTDAYDLSRDGTTAVGVALAPGGFGAAFRYTQSGGMESIGRFSVFTRTVATAISADRQTIVGYGEGPSLTRMAWRWRSDTGFVSLGHLEVGEPNNGSFALDVSADGSVIVGRQGVSAATIWDAAHGWRRVSDVLQNEFGVDMSQWRLISAESISDDGRMLSGHADFILPNGARQSRGWVAIIPSPSTGAALMILCGWSSFRRRR